MSKKYDVNKIIDDVNQVLRIDKWIDDSKINTNNPFNGRKDFWRLEPSKCSGYGRKKCESEDAHWYTQWGRDYTPDPETGELKLTQTNWWAYCDDCYDLHCGRDPIIRKILNAGGEDAREVFE